MPCQLASRILPDRAASGRKTLLLALFLTFIFSFSPLARSQDQDIDDAGSNDSHVRIVRISYIDGEVRMDSGHGFENVTMNVPVTEHNWLETRSDGWAEVQFEDGSLLRLAPDTVVIFTELSRLSSGGTVTTVDLDQGEAEFKITKHDESDFQVTVKKKTIVLLHSGTFRVTSTNSYPMEVVVFKGEVAIRDSESGGEIAVRKNETFVLDAMDFARYALDKGAEADSLDQWSKERDDSLSTYAAAKSYSQSPYQYGASDLNYYGQYYDAPGYGNVWQPNGVGLGWDPFSNGYWSYAPGFGYTWVSSYPWGWLPFRYGRWVFVNGRGWCWAPGGWSGWHRGPRWANAPPGFRPPVPPADRKIVGGAPGQIIRPGAGGRGVGDRDRDRVRGNSAQDGGNRGSRRVLTNDDVQAKVPRTDVPAQQPPVPAPVERRPAILDQHRGPEGGGEIHRDTGRFRGDREPSHVPPPQSYSPPNRQPELTNAPPPSQPARQYNPPPQSYSPPNRQPDRMDPPAQPVRQNNPPQSYSPPNRQPENPSPSQPVRQYTPPPQPAPQVHPSAPPPAQVQQSAPQPPRQLTPPPESRSRPSDDGSRARPK